MRTRLEIRRIELFSLFKVAFYIYAVIGLLVGLLYVFFLLVIGGVQSAILGDEFADIGVLGGVLGILAIPFVAVIYGAVGSVFVTIAGLIFNLICGAVGGLRFETEVQEVYDAPRTRPAPPPEAPPGGGSITPPDGPTLTRSPTLDD